MRGTILLITAAAGAVIGAAVTHSLRRDEAHVPTLVPLPTPAGGLDTAADQALHADGGVRGISTTAERAEIYRVAAAANTRELGAMIRAAAAEPPSAARKFALEVLLTRYAELDPAAAVDAAAGLEAELRAPLYAAWAATDPAAALAALAEVDDPGEAGKIAAALVPALGGDDRALRQVAAAVPFGVESSVYADAITARAAGNPRAAFTQALALTDVAARSQALEGIAQSWVRLDAQAALAAADEISDPFLRQPFLASIARSWARLDPDASLAYLVSLDRNARPDVFGVLGGQLAQVRPREILALDDAPATPTGMPLRMMAIQALAAQDPELALREAEKLPAGGQRESAIMSIARNYGQRDPNGALDWARSTADPSRLSGVLTGIAQNDPERAFDLAMSLETPMARMQALQSVVLGTGRNLGANAAEMADRVLALPDADLRDNTLRTLLNLWSSRAPDEAVEWLLAHQSAEMRGAYGQVGAQLARGNPTRAVDYTLRIPATARNEWLQGVAQGYAQYDAQGAADWLAQYRGDPIYAAGVGVVATALARSDPAAAARLLATANNRGTATQAAYSVASQWAQRDPLAAAAWATEFDATAEQPLAVPSVAATWAQSDFPAARAWALRMPEGRGRDGALTAVLQAANADAPDTALLDAFSDPAARNQAIVNSAMALARRDRARAERLIDTYVTDAAARDQAKQMLDRMPTQTLMFDSQGVMTIR